MPTACDDTSVDADIHPWPKRVSRGNGTRLRMPVERRVERGQRHQQAALRHRHSCRFGSCNGTPAGCAVWILPTSLTKPSREVGLAPSSVAMPQSRVTLTNNPHRFILPTERVIVARCRFNSSRCTMRATRSKIGCAEATDRLIIASPASLRPARCLVRAERLSQHVARSSWQLDRSRATTVRLGRSVRLMIHVRCSPVSPGDRLRSTA